MFVFNDEGLQDPLVGTVNDVSHLQAIFICRNLVHSCTEIVHKAFPPSHAVIKKHGMLDEMVLLAFMPVSLLFLAADPSNLHQQHEAANQVIGHSRCCFIFNKHLHRSGPSKVNYMSV